MSKEELRKKYLEKRRSLTGIALATQSKKLCSQFFSSVNLHGVNILHLFLPLQKFNEPDTGFIIQELTEKFPAIQIAVPKVDVGTNELVHFLWKGAEIATGRWGLSEPVSGTAILPEQIDLVIVPLLAFDLQGNRLGYGKGFYDRFLKTCRADCRTIGVSFFSPEHKIPATSNDIRLNAVVTPEHFYSF
jgi:5-formyltetrahydrofolate cyclo-ligase